MPVKRSEASIQEAVVKYARKRGIVAIKLSTNGRFGSSGWPDYLFLPPKAPTFMVEFKSELGVLSALQKERIKEINDRISVYLVDNVALGKKIVERYL